jgi:hypothetical protein
LRHNSGDIADNCRAERLVGYSEAYHFPSFLTYQGGVTLMLKSGVVGAVAFFFAALFGRSEGWTWN